MNGAYNVELRLAVTFAVSSMIHTAGYTDLIIGLGDMELLVGIRDDLEVGGSEPVGDGGWW